MYESSFLQTALSKLLNVPVNQKVRPSICFKTCSELFEILSQTFESFGLAFETLNWGLKGLKEN